MSWALWAVTSAALAAEPGMPPGHPQMGPATGALPPGHPALTSPAADTPLPPGHPALTPPPADGPLPAGHPKVDRTRSSPPESSDELIKKLDASADLKTREKTFEVAAALGKLYYSHARYPEAAEFLGQAQTRAEATRTLLLAERRKAAALKRSLPTAEQAGCATTAQSTLDSLTALAQAKSRSGDVGAAAVCAEEALRPALEVGRLRANALFLAHDGAGALGELDRVLVLWDHDSEALFLRGAVRLDQAADNAALARAKDDLGRSISAAPTSPRAGNARDLIAHIDAAVAEGGLAKWDAHQQALAHTRALEMKPPAAQMPPVASGSAPALSQNLRESVQNTERTPEFEANLTRLMEEAEAQLASAQYQEALSNYRGVIPFRPGDARAQAGMAWALVGLGKPTAERVWTVAVSTDPQAVERLGDALKAKGDAKGAQALWGRLAQSAPEYAERSGLKAKLGSP